MKNVVWILGALLVSHVSFAHEDFDLECKSSDGLELVVMNKKNPKNQADAFIALTGPKTHLGGWAWMKESSPGATLFSSVTYDLSGNFPQGSTLKVVTRVKACGRGSCDYGLTVTTAKLMGPDEEVYFNCL